MSAGEYVCLGCSIEKKGKIRERHYEEKEKV